MGRHSISIGFSMHKSKRTRLKIFVRMMQCIRDIQKLTLNIEPHDHPICWIYSSYAMKSEMLSQTGIYMAIKKATYTSSCKQKLNSKSSTESELVEIYNSMA